jgi:hypothetical protein
MTISRISKGLLITLTLCLSHSPVLAKKFTLDPNGWHEAKTPAEQRLDDILQKSFYNENMLYYMINHPKYDPSKSNDYKSFFSEKLLRAWANEEAKLVKKNCGGVYKEGGDCGFSATLFNPLTCLMDPAIEINYQTIAEYKETSFIATASSSSMYGFFEEAFYRLALKDGIWQVDGVECHKGMDFNIP